MHQSYYDENYTSTNRDNKKSPKRLMGWCDGCDTVMVSDGQKCPHCGHRQGDVRKRFKR
jgi:rRNA maturation endonuclease Nob1